MAKKSQRFNSVVKYTESKEEQAAQKLAASQHNLQDQQQRLQSLQQFHDEYAERFTLVGQQGMQAAQVRDYHAFIAKLKGAVEQQQRMVAIAEGNVAEKKFAWIKTRTETQKANIILQRYVSLEQRQADKIEQKDSDEHAQRNHKSRH